MDAGQYYETVIITVLMALSFITLLLIFLYIVYAKEEKKD
jgi:hypothetical protein